MRYSSRIIRASKKNPCPVCGGTGCGIGTARVICHRVEAGSERVCENTGAWVHRRTDNLAEQRNPPRVPPPPPIAPIARRAEIFDVWLGLLELSAAHTEQLKRARGLSLLTIRHCQFATVPSYATADALCETLARNYDLAHVPGFYFDTDRQRWRMRFVGQSGFYVPLRDCLGRIQALQIRRDTDDHRSRYWLVSTPPDQFECGASSGAPPHFTGYADAERLVITEGGLKAEVCSEQLPHVWFCGLVAVGSFGANFGWYLRQYLPNVREVGIAYDADWRTNSKVSAQLERMRVTLETAGYVPETLNWSADEGKGFDDYLLRQRKGV